MNKVINDLINYKRNVQHLVDQLEINEVINDLINYNSNVKGAVAHGDYFF